MLPRARKCLACVLLIGGGAMGVAANAVAGPGIPDDATLRRLIVPAVIMEKDRRAAPDQELRARHGATGLVRCGTAIGTAQLALKNDVIITAGHVLMRFDGRPRTGCLFEPLAGGGTSGSRSTLARSAAAAKCRSMRLRHATGRWRGSYTRCAAQLPMDSQP